MAIDLLQEVTEMINTMEDQPSITIILPIEPKTSKAERDSRLQTAYDGVEDQLYDNYPEYRIKPALAKLQSLMKNLNFTTHKKSVAVFVSPLIQKVYYLDIPLGEKIIIDDTFEIRDLVYSKNETYKYLVLVLGDQRTKIYLGDSTEFMRIDSNAPAAFENHIDESAGSFADPVDGKEILLDKLFKHTDKGLSLILNAHPLPLFILGTDKNIGYFQKLTHNKRHIAGCVHGDFEEAYESEILKAIKPRISDWKKIKLKDLMQRLDAALDARKLLVGIKEVLKAAASKDGELLIVEKKYMHPVRSDIGTGNIHQESLATSSNFYTRDAVDHVIERVLENGGDVEFVDEEILKDYKHIVLI